MAKDLTTDVQTEINAEASFPITLYDVVAVGEDPLYIAEHDNDVIFDGKRYLGYPVRHQPVRTGLEEVIDNVRVTISVVDRTLITLIQQTNGLRDASITITTVFADMLDDPDNKIVTFEGRVASVNINETEATFEVTSLWDLQDIEIPRRIFRRMRCGWIYKDTDTCQYAGPLPTCDKVLDGTNGCQAHANTKHFGAFPAIPERRNRGI